MPAVPSVCSPVRVIYKLGNGANDRPKPVCQVDHSRLVFPPINMSSRSRIELPHHKSSRLASLRNTRAANVWVDELYLIMPITCPARSLE